MENTLPVIDYNHIFLYAKSWYKRADLIDDIQTILSERSACDKQYYSPPIIVEMLTTIALPYLRPLQIEELIKVALGISLRCRGSGSIGNLGLRIKETIEYLIGQLSIISVKENGKFILNLGEPDPSVLELKVD